jgi:hypothetical protein
MGNLQEIEEEMKKEFRSFEDTKKFVQSLNLKGQSDWIEYRKSGNKPDDIPTNPNRTFKKEWKGYGDFLGTGNVSSHNKIFLSFTDARTFAQSLNLKTVNEWIKYAKSSNKPSNIPSDPSHNYKNKGWDGYGDFLGTGNVYKKDFLSFEEARKFVQSLGLKGHHDWQKYCKSGNKHENIPIHPERGYKKDWKNWGDWLGTGNVRKKDFLSFEEARKFVLKLNFKNRVDWEKYCKSGNRPENIPSHPQLNYKNKGWLGYGDFLGTGNIANHKKEYISFEESRKFAHTLNLKNMEEWYDYCASGNKHENIPASPYNSYKKDWKGYGDFLGTGTIANQNMQFRSFIDAREFVQKLKFQSTTEWFTYSKSGNKPKDIPSLPSGTYKKEWQGWEDFLGDEFNPQVEFCSYEEAKKFVQSLGLKSSTEWREYCKSGNKPDNIPTNPWTVYRKSNNQRMKRNEKRI